MTRLVGLLVAIGTVIGSYVTPVQAPTASGPHAASTVAPPTSPGEPTTVAHDDSVFVSGSDVVGGVDRVPGARDVVGGPPPAPPLVEFLRAEVCGVLSAGVGSGWPCSDGRVVDHSGVCGSAPVVLALWRRERASVQVPWSAWSLVSDVSCGVVSGPSPEQVLAEFRRLPILASVVHVQPDRGWVLVNMDTIAFVDPVRQRLSASVLGTQVWFEVWPVSYAWDFGEGRFTTSSPGHPFPGQDVMYRYRRAGVGRVGVVTTWQATYSTSVDGTVRPVPGTATTTTTGPVFEVVEAHAHLTRGDCRQYPHDPGC